MPKKRMYSALLEDYSKKMLENYLENEMILEVAQEVLMDNKEVRDPTLYSPAMRADIEYVDNMVERAVKELAKEAVAEVTEGIVSHYMRQKQENLPKIEDPVELLHIDFLERVVG